MKGYFGYIIKKHGEKTENPTIRVYINKFKKYDYV